MRLTGIALALSTFVVVPELGGQGPIDDPVKTLLGGVLAFAFSAAVCTAVGYGAGCDAWGAVAALGVGGVVGGALIGAGIGSQLPRWQLRYTRGAPVR